MIDAIAFKFQTGTQWVYLPEKYGNWRGVYNRLRMWAIDGTWQRVFTALIAQPVQGGAGSVHSGPGCSRPREDFRYETSSEEPPPRRLAGPPVPAPGPPRSLHSRPESSDTEPVVRASHYLRGDCPPGSPRRLVAESGAAITRDPGPETARQVTWRSPPRSSSAAARPCHVPWERWPHRVPRLERSNTCRRDGRPEPVSCRCRMRCRFRPARGRLDGSGAVPFGCSSAQGGRAAFQTRKVRRRGRRAVLWCALQGVTQREVRSCHQKRSLGQDLPVLMAVLG
ncbi:transposase [Streptomyces sp. IBSBF 2394]|uniref:transposase n=1 Tax=Streptomyces sp. IBSBF 2394 TaxID=2903532 RepID=UPI003FA6EAB9